MVLLTTINMYVNKKLGAEWLAPTGRIFYGLAIAGIGLMHFLYEGFRPIILPLAAEVVRNYSFAVYVVGAYILVSGIFIVAGKKTHAVTTVLGIAFLLFLLFGHLPIRLLTDLEIRESWIDTIKLLALSGGAFVISETVSYRLSDKAQKYFHRLTQLGSYFFAVMLILFGTAHLISPMKISELVPKYIPFPIFWTLIGGIALIGSGLCIFFKYQLRTVSILLAIMLFLWLLMLHLYYAFHFPEFQDGENIIGSLQCLAFCGIALTVSEFPKPKKSV
jgi:uncharacterized membrane protein